MSSGALADILKSRWLLLLVLLVFICFKIPYLDYPFYIDEAQVYAPGARIMAAHGPSLMPGSLHEEFARGHPLLFYFLCSTWILIFGSSHIAMHAFPLLLSVIFLIVLHECCLWLFGRRT